jgi:hypothetical protein
MPIRRGAPPENSFDTPLGLLSDCHRRIERFLEQLLRVAETARGGALDAGQRAALGGRCATSGKPPCCTRRTRKRRCSPACAPRACRTPRRRWRPSNAWKPTTTVPTPPTPK